VYAVNHATDLQVDQLRIARAIPSFVVEGPAGTGKTTMALQKARELVSQNKKVALICYSKGLSKFLQKQVSGWQGPLRPEFVGTFHQLVDFWDGKTPQTITQDWWEDGAAEEMMKQLGQRNNLQLFDAVVIDEGQDFRDSWWDVIYGSFRTEITYNNELTGSNLFVFGDSQQSIFGRSRYKEIALPRLTLDVNMRNTEAIGEVVDILTDIEVKTLGPLGPPIQHVPTNYESAITEGEVVLQELLDEGWQPGDIAFLTTGSRHKEFHKNIIERNVNEYWDRYFNGEEVFYSTVQLFKGLERPVVVLAINGWKRDDLIDEFFYVGISRARDLLVIVGEIPAHINEKIHRHIQPYREI
jgi:superfamily I DNA/RNA helicase